MLGERHLELLFESGGIHVEIGWADGENVFVGGGRPRFVAVTAEIRLPGDPPRHLGWVEPPGEHALGGALEEPLQTSFQASCQAHRREVTVGRGQCRRLPEPPVRRYDFASIPGEWRNW